MFETTVRLVEPLFLPERTLARKYGLNLEEVRQAVRRLERSKPGLNRTPVLLGLAFGVVWPVVMSVVLFETGLASLLRINDTNEFAWIVGLSAAPAIVGAGAIVSGMRWWMVRREFVTRQVSKACYTCGYSLVGLPSVGGWVKCPECGERSPVGGESAGGE